MSVEAYIPYLTIVKTPLSKVNLFLSLKNLDIFMFVVIKVPKNFIITEGGCIARWPITLSLFRIRMLYVCFVSFLFWMKVWQKMTKR